MKLLLDTHTFIWWDRQPDLIPSETLALMQQSDSQLFVSLVSLWEIQIKTQIGKLSLQTTLAEMIAQQQTENGVILLPIALPHVLELDNLPQHHKDPFDRLLIAQCRYEGATLISRDSVFEQYDCPLIWVLRSEDPHR
jgi:PIN domain nuclease of toxin-antitoxin system